MAFISSLTASLLRSAIGFAPLLLASVVYRDDHTSLLVSTRYFLAFSLAAAVGSLGVGAYIYSLNLSSSSPSSMSQRVGIIAYIFEQINTKWWIFPAILVPAILWTMGALALSIYQTFFLAASLFVAPTLLVSTQYFLSVGSRKLFLVHTSLQSFVLISFLPFARSLQDLPWFLLIPLALVFLGIKKYVSRSCLQDCWNRSFDDARLLHQLSANEIQTLRTASKPPTIYLSTRLKCFVDSFFPLAYTSFILLFFERLQSSSSESYQLLFYNYSRISDAIVSLFVTFCTLSVSKKMFGLLDSAACIDNSESSATRRRVGNAIVFLFLQIFSVFIPCLCVGYAFNYMLLGYFSIVLASFDILISSLKLMSVFISLYMITRLASLALVSQFISLIAVLLGAYLVSDLAAFLALVVVALVFSSLLPLSVYLVRARLSTFT